MRLRYCRLRVTPVCRVALCERSSWCAAAFGMRSHRWPGRWSGVGESLVDQPKSLERLQAGLEILQREVKLPKGSIEQFAQDPEHYWTPAEESDQHVLSRYYRDRSVDFTESLLADVSRLAPITGLWPVDTSEWESPYPSDMASGATLTPLERVHSGLEFQNEWTTGANFALPKRLAAPGSSRTKQSLGDYSFSLVQADSLADLIRYVPTETFGNNDSMNHWVSMVERFEMQLLAGEWHGLAFFVHRPPTTREEAELLLLELQATGFDDDGSTTVDTLLEGGLLVLWYS
jgi:hypothetical protein